LETKAGKLIAQAGLCRMVKRPHHGKKYQDYLLLRVEIHIEEMRRIAGVDGTESRVEIRQ
jgi:hypothetical protein